MFRTPGSQQAPRNFGLFLVPNRANHTQLAEENKYFGWFFLTLSTCRSPLSPLRRALPTPLDKLPPLTGSNPTWDFPATVRLPMTQILWNPWIFPQLAETTVLTYPVPAPAEFQPKKSINTPITHDRLCVPHKTLTITPYDQGGGVAR
jgi:hypothetical protein